MIRPLLATVLSVVLLGACAHTQPPSTSGVTPPAARALASQARLKADSDPKASLDLYQQAWDAGAHDNGTAYDAACIASRLKDKDGALRWLERAVQAGWTDSAWMQKDEDLAPLRDDPRFAQLVEQATANMARENAAIQQPELAKEILAMADVDQEARFRMIRQTPPGEKPAPEIVQELAAIDAKHSARMKEILAQYGWPGRKLVGKQASSRAWLLVQHDDHDVEFQRQCLSLLEKAVAAGDAEPQQWAYLYDRLQVNEHKPQRFGTQFHTVDGKQVPQPMEDPEHVDERRASVGLGTMAEYAAQMQQMYKTPASPK